MAPQLAADLARDGFLSGRYVDVKGAAEILHVSASFLNKARMVGAGAGPPFLKIGAAVRYDVQAIEAWAESRVRSSTSDSGEAA
jgi:hypothetical protein